LEVLPEPIADQNVCVVIEGCRNVKSLEGLNPNFCEIQAERSGLTSLEGCPDDIDSLYVDSTEITSFDGISNLICNILSAESCVKLTSLNGLPIEVNYLYLTKSNNIQLDDFDRLKKVKSLAVSLRPGILTKFHELIHDTKIFKRKSFVL
jgi:hypothetical protein